MRQILRYFALLFVVGLAGCGGSSNDNAALLNLNNPGSGTGGTTGRATLRLICPATILAGKDAAGFSATLTSSAGRPVPNVFVSLVSAVGDTPMGSIVASNFDGTTNPGGGTTNSTGIVNFTVRAPATSTRLYRLTVTGSNVPSATSTFTAVCPVNVSPNPISIVMSGPRGAPSGSVGIVAGSSAVSGFSARVIDSAGDPVPDIELTFSTESPDITESTGRGRINTVGTGKITDADGRVSFRYQPPTTVRTSSDIDLVATAAFNGATVSRSYTINVFPAEAPAPVVPPKLNLMAPNGQASGSASVISEETQGGFFVQLLDGNDNTPLVGQTVSLSFVSGTAKASSAGAIRVTNPVSSSQPNVGRTDSQGRVNFSFEAPTLSTTSPQVYTITATTTIDGTALTSDFAVRVLPRGQPTLSLRAANNEPSSSVVLAAGERRNDFVIVLRDGLQKPISASALSVTATQGRISYSGAQTTDLDGQLRFDYTAPTTVTEIQQIIIRVSGMANGYQIPAVEYLLDVAPSMIEITGPQGAQSGTVSIVAGNSQSGFRLRLTDGANRPLIARTVSVRPRTSGGTTSAAAAGTVTTARSTTDADGVITFSFTAPRPDTQNDTPIIIGAQTAISGQTISSDFSVTVVSRGVPTLLVRGPGDAPSGQPTVAADDTLSGFSATFLDGSGAVISGRTLTLGASSGTASPSAGSSLQTDSNGQVRFDYFSPQTVSARTRATLTISGQADGSSVSSSYLVNLTPPAAASAPQLMLTGPTDAKPGQKRTGFTASFVRANGQAIEGEPVAISITRGTVSIVENGTERPGQTTGITDSFGVVSFVVTPNSASQDSTSTVTASAGSGGSSVVQQQCSVSGAICSDTLNVTVRADTFLFTDPAYGTSVPVGINNAQPLTFSWRDSSGVGVAACIDLDATFQGASNAPYGLVVSGDPTPRTQIRRVQLDANGSIQTGISIYSDRSGFVEIRARENRQCLDGGSSSSTGLSTVTGVQFQDVQGSANNHVDLDAPLQVITSPDASGNQRRATVTLSVLNDAFGALDGAQVLFTIAPASGRSDPNERVFPGGGTTDANGLASTEYYVPSVTLAAGQSTFVDITGCLRGSSSTGGNDGTTCSTRRIQIVPPPP